MTPNNFVEETLTLLKNFIEGETNIKIETPDELKKFIDSPQLFTDDRNTIEKMNRLRNVIIGTGGFYV